MTNNLSSESKIPRRLFTFRAVFFESEQSVSVNCRYSVSPSPDDQLRQTTKSWNYLSTAIEFMTNNELSGESRIPRRLLPFQAVSFESEQSLSLKQSEWLI